MLLRGHFSPKWGLNRNAWSQRRSFTYYVIEVERRLNRLCWSSRSNKTRCHSRTMPCPSTTVTWRCPYSCPFRPLQVSQTIARGGPRSQIAIPAQGMIEFRDALTDLLEEFGTDDGGEWGVLTFVPFFKCHEVAASLVWTRGTCLEKLQHSLF